MLKLSRALEFSPTNGGCTNTNGHVPQGFGVFTGFWYPEDPFGSVMYDFGVLVQLLCCQQRHSRNSQYSGAARETWTTWQPPSYVYKAKNANSP